MGTHEINGKPLRVDPFKGRSSDKCDKRWVSQDKVQFSDAAQAKKIEQIREKVRKGFYFQPEVTDMVLELLPKDLTKS